MRTRLDVRRVWRCIKCGRTVRTGGNVVSQRCGCAEAGSWMVLQPPVKREPFQPPMRERLFDPGAEDAPATVPSDAAGDQSCNAAVPAAETQAGRPHHNAAEQPAVGIESPVAPSAQAAEGQADLAAQDAADPPAPSPDDTAEFPVAAPEPPTAVDAPVGPTEVAPGPAAEPGVSESRQGDAPPDDFGAGLGN